MRILSLLSGLALTLFMTGVSAQDALINRSATFTAGSTLAETGYTTAGSVGSNTANTNSGRGFDRSVWSSSFGGELRDECYTAIQTTDGGYALIGRSNSVGAGNFDAWLIKTDANGNKLWEKTFGDTYIDEAYVIRETSDGGLIIGGMSTAFGWAGEGWLIKTDNQGNIIWNNGYHPMDSPLEVGWDYIYDIIPTSDGGFIFGGVGAPAVGVMQAWVGKVDENGVLLWDNCFGGIYWERIFSMTPTSDGGFAAVGDRHWTYDDITWQHNGWLLKFDENGDTTWTKHFGQVEHDIFRNVKQTSEGGYIICGESEGGVKMGFHGWIVCTDDQGNELWNKHMAKGGLYGVQVTDGTYTFGGVYVDAYHAGEGWLINADTDGTINWESLVDGSLTDDMFLSLNLTNDGGLIGGGKYAQSGDFCDYWLVKIDPEGPEALTYFYEDFDGVTQPALPDDWTKLVDVMLSNTVAEIRTMENGIAPTAPNAVFVMNGLDGSNGQPDPTAFVALITPFVKVGEDGALITISAAGTNAIQIGTLTDPQDPDTWTMLSEIPLISDFTDYQYWFTTPGEMYIGIKHSNQTQVTPLFIDHIEFRQTTVGVSDVPSVSTVIYPNPAPGNITITSNEKMAYITLYNLTGTELYTLPVASGTFTLQRNDLPDGVYFVKINYASGNSGAYKLIFK